MSSGAPVDASIRHRCPSDLQRRGIADVPVLLLWGEHDTVTPPEMARRFSQELAGSTLIIYPNAGHVAMLENPDESAEDVRRFLRENGIGPD